VEGRAGGDSQVLEEVPSDSRERDNFFQWNLPGRGKAKFVLSRREERERDSGRIKITN